MGKKANLFVLVFAIGLIGLLLPNQITSSGTSEVVTATPTTESSTEPSAEPEPSSEESPSEAATETATPEATPDQTADAVANNSTIEELILQLQIAAEITEGYDRDLFKHWIDSDGDGCNTRKEVLIAEARVKPTVSGGCELSGGEWYSPYDKVTTTDPSDFDIDHFVPLNEAWQSGAYGWSSDKRRDFANDLGFGKSLIAVTASSNRSKSDRDPANWLPTNNDYVCEYVTSWIEVKIRWGLTADQPEVDALRSYSKDCD